MHSVSLRLNYFKLLQFIKINKILIASGNKAKIEQFEALLNELKIKSTSQSLEVIEDGKTPQENASGYDETHPSIT